MKAEFTLPEEFADLVAEKVIERLKPLLESRLIDSRPVQQHPRETDPMRALNEHEVAHLVGKSVQSLRNDRYLGKGAPYFKVGRAISYRRGEVLNWSETQRVEPRR